MSGKPHDVLLVDDDAAMMEMYRIGLETEGFRVRTLPHALTLNDEVATLRPDIVVLDWELPGILGDEALVRLRGTESGRDVPVLFLSNFPGTHDGAIDRAFAYGAIGWLEKMNTTPTRLAVRLREAVEVHR